MKIKLPNIFLAKLFAALIPDKYNQDISFTQSALVGKELVGENVEVALIPSCDLLAHPNLFVSKHYGISCNGMLSNAQIFYAPSKKGISKIGLYGDVTSNEIILPRIIYPEKFSSEIKITLETKAPDLSETNIIVVGDKNYDDEYFNKGMSFAEEMSELMTFPYVNFVLAAKDDSFLAELCLDIEEANIKLEDVLPNFLEKSGLSLEKQEFIKQNLDTLYYELTDSENFGLEEMLKLPYYHGVVENMVDVNFV